MHSCTLDYRNAPSGWLAAQTEMERPNWQRTPAAPGDSLRGAPLVFLDLETTGLHVDKGATLVEAALVDSGGVPLHWHRAPDALPSSELVERLDGHFEARTVVGHNVTFDLQFLADRAARLDVAAPRARYVDTLALARRHVPNASTHTLEVLTEHFDLETDGEFHDAIPDAKLARQLFWHLADREELTTLGEAGLKRFDIRGT